MLKDNIVISRELHHPSFKCTFTDQEEDKNEIQENNSKDDRKKGKRDKEIVWKQQQTNSYMVELKPIVSILC